MADIANLVISISTRGKEQAVAAIEQVKAAGSQVSSKPIEMRFDVKGANEAVAIMNKMKAAGMSGGIYNVKVDNAAQAVAAGKQINTAMAQLGDTTSKVRVGIGSMAEVGRASFVSLSGGITHAVDGLLRMARVVASVAVVFFLFRGAIGIFTNLLNIVDDFQVSIISIAAGLTNVTASGQGSFEKIYEQHKKTAGDMYRSITLEAVKHFSTANEMMTSYNKLVQFGYGVRLDEVKALGVLTDVIKLKTKGQDVERQLNTEIMALMQGQARAGSLLAQDLLTRLGPGWKNLVEQHKKAGDLLAWLASLYPGVDAANKDILKTMDSQYATTKSLLSLIVIGGFDQAYKDVVEVLQELNKYLLENEIDLRNRLASAWDTVGKSLLSFAGSVATVIWNTLEWISVNGTLLKSLVELYIISKIIALVTGLYTAIQTWMAASVIVTGVITGLIPILLGAAQTTTTYSYATGGAATATVGLTAAGTALNAMMMTLLPSIVAVSAALAIYGAYKSFKGEGDTGQGIGTPGTATIGDDMWEYVYATEAIPEDPFRGPIISLSEFNVKLTDTEEKQDIIKEWLETKWKLYIDTSQAFKDLDLIIEKVRDAFNRYSVWNIAINFIMGKTPTPSTSGLLPEAGGNKMLEESNYKVMRDTIYGKTPGESAAQSISEIDVSKLWGQKWEEIMKLKLKQGVGKGEKGGKGGGGGGGDGERQRLNSMFDTLTKDIARLSEGKLSEIEANYNKTVEQIYKKTSDRVTTQAELEVLAKKRASLQKTKAEEEYTLFIAKNSGDQYAELDAQATKWLQDYRGFKNAEVNIADITARKKTIIDVDLYTKKGNLLKTHIDAMASESPYLVEQLAYKKQSLSIENELAMAAIKKAVAEDKNLKPLEDQLIANQKNLVVAKQYTLERANWEQQGWEGGAKIYGVERANEAAKRGATEFKNMMDSVESTLGDTLGTTFVDAITGKKIEIKAMFEDLLGSAVKSIFKMGVTRGFDLIGDLLNPKKGEGKAEGVGGILGGLLGKGKVLGSSPGIPMYVAIVSSSGGLGGDLGGDLGGLFGGLFGGGGKDSGESEVSEITGMWDGIVSGFDTVFNSGSSELMTTSTYWEGMFGNSNTNLLMNSDTYGGMFASSIGGLESTAGSWGGMFSNAVSGLLSVIGGGGGGGIFDTIGGIADTVIGFLHTGGLVAHTGMLVAHGGLSVDERLIKAQVGEGIIKRDTMSAYARRGISFDMLNSGQVGVSGGSVDNSVSVTIDARGANKDIDWNHIVKRQIIPQIDKALGRRGQQRIARGR